MSFSCVVKCCYFLSEIFTLYLIEKYEVFIVSQNSRSKKITQLLFLEPILTTPPKINQVPLGHASYSLPLPQLSSLGTPLTNVSLKYHAHFPWQALLEHAPYSLPSPQY